MSPRVAVAAKPTSANFTNGAQKTIATLEAVGLGDFVNVPPNNLSGGQKQRVAIACALVSHLHLTVANELTAALDSKSGRDVVDLISVACQENGCTVLLVTHDNCILDIADRVTHLEDGKLAQPP